MTDCPDCAERAKQMAAAGAPQQAPAGWPPQPQQPQSPSAPWQQPVTSWQPPQAPPPQQAWQPPPPAPPPQVQWPPAATAYAPSQPEPPAYAPPQQQYTPLPPPPYAPPPPPQHPQYAQQPPAAWPPPETRSAPPAWLVGVGTAVVFLLLGAGIYYFLNRSDSSSAAGAQDKTGVASSGDASKGKVTNPLQKYVEVVGIRMATQDKQPVARFVVVNHSGAEIVDLAVNVTLLASTSRSDEDSVGTFSFKLPSIGAGESKELTQPLKTKLKPYELPDWQNTTAEVQITSPAQ
jgi:hypothetical protein